MATAVAAMHDAEGREIGSEPRLGFLVASLHVDYVKRTLIGAVVELRAAFAEWDRRKVRVRTDLFGVEDRCARAEVLVVRVTEAKILGAA